MKKGLTFAGVLMMAAGIACMVFPLASVVTIGKILGAAMLVWGVSSLIRCICDMKSIWKGLASMLVTIAGAIVFLDAFSALATIDVIVKVFAAFTLFSGITQMMVAVGAKEVVHNWVAFLLTGILNVVLALLILANPFTGLLVADCMIAFELLMAGGLLISFSFVKPDIEITVTNTVEETVEA